jgi:DNA polymerase/3'-5' exonuclease PolX
MEYSKAKKIADSVLQELKPHCERIEIAGSIRRKKANPNDIEIVAIPKPYDVDLFESGIATVVNMWERVKGTLPCKYTQRILPEGIKLDLFFATVENWGLIFAIRTGSAEFSHQKLAMEWVRQGYRSKDGMLEKFGELYPIREERELFELLGIAWVDPVDRTI